VSPKGIKTALITGGGSGMGLTVAEELCRSGVTVFVADRNLAAIQNQSNPFDALKVDVSRSEQVKRLFDTLKERIDRLDLLVHCAGILGKTAFIDDMEDEEWRRVMTVNLDGAFYCCREAVRWMKVHQFGRIILFSSVASLTPTPGAVHYSAAKGGINMLGKTLAKEVAADHIQVNIIAPGYIRTPMLEQMPEGFLNHILKKTPSGRLGETEEIAALVSFLASDQAGFFTGQIFSPNGGLVI
jgi:NAD(P)-dependent dehydrogenase (short-subunit alcohol dehydrogenase family)